MELTRDIFIPGSKLYAGSEPLRAVQVFLDVFPSMIKMYAPIHFVPTLLFRWRKLSPRVLLHCLSSTIRSATFLSSFVSIFVYTLCLLRNIRRRDDRWFALVAGAMCATSVEIERASRRTELAVYCIPRALETLWKFAEFPYMRGGNTIIFAGAIGIVMAVFHGLDKTAVKSTYASVLRFLFDFDYTTAGLTQPPNEIPSKKKSKDRVGEHDHGSVVDSEV